MYKLIDFLCKEIPDDAESLNNAIDITLKNIERTCEALSFKYIENAKKYFKDGNSDEIIRNFRNTENQLRRMENNLLDFMNCDIEIDFTLLESILTEENNEEDIVEEENEEDIAEKEKEDNEVLEAKIDYKKYLVDTTISYPLSSDFENTTPDAFSYKGEKYSVKTYMEMWLKLCEILYEKDKNTFERIATWHQIKGHKKSYIVYETDKIAQNITNPIRLLNTNILLEGTTSTSQKIKIILQMLEIYKISTSSIKVYLKSDRHPKHRQEPIGTYIDKNYDYKAEIDKNIKDNEDIVQLKPEFSVSKMAYNYFKEYFENTTLSYDIGVFLDEKWCKDVLNLSYPLLKEIDADKPLKEQTFPNGKTVAYYAQNQQIQINDNMYMIYMRWTDKMHRNRLEKWISEHPIPVVDACTALKSKDKCIYYDFKKDLCENLENPLFNKPCNNATYCKYYLEKEVYVVPKDRMKNKFCPHCGLQAEYDYLEVNNSETPTITKKLHILRCRHCEKDFINTDLYRNYIRNKNLDCLDVKFIEFK